MSPVYLPDEGADPYWPTVPAAPEQETRGGEDIDWAGARPGEPLPVRRPQPELPEEDPDGT